MVAPWGSDSEESNDEDVDETSSMAIRDSSIKEVEETSEGSILEIKKITSFF